MGFVETALALRRGYFDAFDQLWAGKLNDSRRSPALQDFFLTSRIFVFIRD